MLANHQIAKAGREANPITHCDNNKLGQLQNSSGAKNGAIDENAVSDPSLRLIIDYWDKIPDSLKLAIVVQITGAVASR